MLKLSSLSVDPAYWLGKILPYIPTPKKSSRRGKIIFSSILALIFLFLCVPLKSVKNPYAEKMLAFSPAEQAREIKNRDRENPQAALDYIKFYQGLPDVKPDAALEEVKAEVEADRSLADKTKSMAEEIVKQYFGEDNAQLIELIQLFMPAGVNPYHYISLYKDGGKLYEYVGNFQNDKDINFAELGVDSAGFLLGIAAILPPPLGNAAKPANKAIAPVRKVWKKIPDKVKQNISDTFKPVLVTIENSNLMVFNRRDFDDLKALYETKKDQFNKVRERTEAALAQLGPILEVSAKSEPVAEVVLLNSPTPEELKNNLKLVKGFEKEDMPILQFGGVEALRAAARLQKRGEFDTQVLKAAMRYGPAGLAAVGNMPRDDIRKGDFSPKRGYSWLQILLLVLYVPYAVLALIKTWRPGLGASGSAKEA